MNRESDNGDRVLGCCECGDDFVLTRQEMQWYQSMGWGDTLPRRCKPCRKARRQGFNGERVDNRLTSVYDGYR